MKSPRLGFIILVLGLVFAGTYLIANIFKRPGRPTTQQPPSIKLSSLKLAPFSSENFDEKNNLTKALGQNLFEQIQIDNLINNERRSLPADINSISEKLANSVISESLADFKLVSVVYDSDIKISPDNSKTAVINYLTAIGGIAKNRMAGFGKNYLDILSDIVQKNDFSSANRFAEIQRNIANDYFNLTIPSTWVDFHKKLIIHFKNSEIVFRAISDYLNDPIKAYLAIQMIDQLEVKVKENQNALRQKMNEIGL
jgi:hypothetical protein